jgi:hypothetical protein
MSKQWCVAHQVKQKNTIVLNMKTVAYAIVERIEDTKQVPTLVRVVLKSDREYVVRDLFDVDSRAPSQEATVSYCEDYNNIKIKIVQTFKVYRKNKASSHDFIACKFIPLTFYNS